MPCRAPARQPAPVRRTSRRGQRSLFDAFGGDEPDRTTGAEAATDALPEVPEWPETEKLKYEKEAPDFYFSSHPLAQWEKEIRRYSSHSMEELKHLPSEKEVTLGGDVILKYAL